jgi:hypothetical protein
MRRVGGWDDAHGTTRTNTADRTNLQMRLSAQVFGHRIASLAKGRETEQGRDASTPNTRVNNVHIPAGVGVHGAGIVDE